MKPAMLVLVLLLVGCTGTQDDNDVRISRLEMQLETLQARIDTVDKVLEAHALLINRTFHYEGAGESER